MAAGLRSRGAGPGGGRAARPRAPLPGALLMVLGGNGRAACRSGADLWKPPES